MKKYTAEYIKAGQYGTGICTANTIEELMDVLSDRGYTFDIGQRERIVSWSKTNDKKYYGTRLIIRCGELEMTEYTSF